MGLTAQLRLFLVLAVAAQEALAPAWLSLSLLSRQLRDSKDLKDSHLVRTSDLAMLWKTAFWHNC